MKSETEQLLEFIGFRNYLQFCGNVSYELKHVLHEIHKNWSDYLIAKSFISKIELFLTRSNLISLDSFYTVMDEFEVLYKEWYKNTFLKK